MHYSVIVIGEDPETQLEPYDENLEVERYLRASKADLIREVKERFRYEVGHGEWINYVKDKTAWLKEHGKDQSLIQRVETLDKRFLWTDEEWYFHATEYSDDIDPDDGGEYSTRNPDGKWDWYEIGGRWGGDIELNDGTTADTALVKDIKNLDTLHSYYLLNNGVWEGPDDGFNWRVNDYEELRAREADFENHIKEVLKSLSPETRLTIVDVHS